MVAGVPHGVVASVALLLATTITTTLVRPAGASSFYSSTSVVYSFPYTFGSSSFSETCADETFSCRINDACYSCSYLDEVNIRQFEECLDDISVDHPDSSTERCSAIVEGICCFDKLSETDCVTNEQFVDLWLCNLESESCYFDDITCDYNGGAAGPRSNAVVSFGYASFAAFACAFFVHVFPLL